MIKNDGKDVSNQSKDPKVRRLIRQEAEKVKDKIKANQILARQANDLINKNNDKLLNIDAKLKIELSKDTRDKKVINELENMRESLLISDMMLKKIR